MDDDHKQACRVFNFKIFRREFNSPSPKLETIRFNFFFKKQVSYIHLNSHGETVYPNTTSFVKTLTKKFVRINMEKFFVYEETYEEIYRELIQQLPLMHEECKELIEYAYKDALDTISWFRATASCLDIDMEIFVENRYVFRSLNGSNNNTENCCCSICLEELFKKGRNGIWLPCSHVFHRGCLNSWLKETYNCPLCRFKID